MPEFKDAKGDTWQVTVTAGTIKRGLDLLKVDLGKPLDPPEPLLTRFSTDIAFMVDVLYCAVKPQADERDVSDVAFADRLEGEALYAACAAFHEAWASFFRSLRQTYIATTIQKQQAAIQKVYALAETTMASDELDRTIDEELRKVEAEVLSEIRGSFAASSPPSPDVTPSRVPSGS